MNSKDYNFKKKKEIPRAREFIELSGARKDDNSDVGIAQNGQLLSLFK